MLNIALIDKKYLSLVCDLINILCENREITEKLGKLIIILIFFVL